MLNIPKWLAIVVFALTSQSVSALLIDDFSAGDFFSVVTNSSPSDTQIGTGLAGVLGGNRTVDIAIGGNGSVVTTVGSGLLDVGSSAASIATVDVTWDNFSAVDLTEGGLADGIFLSLPTPIDNDLDVTFLINGASTFTNTYPDGSSGDDFFIAFSAFSDPAAFGSVDSIMMSLTDGTGWDAQVDFIETRPRSAPSPMPEPGSLALLGLGLISLRWIFRAR
jgi:hypothetical protein